MHPTDPSAGPTQRPFDEPKRGEVFCISLIGMPGSGKTTLGAALADLLGWVLVDTDNLLEAWWGVALQEVRDRLGLEGFLQAEEKAVLGLSLNRCVISTGGSVIYSEAAMAKLKGLGPVVLLEASLPVIADRVAACPNRGLAMRDGQGIDDLYRERLPLYRRYADFSISTEEHDTQTCAQVLRDWLDTHYEAHKTPENPDIP